MHTMRLESLHRALPSHCKARCVYPLRKQANALRVVASAKDNQRNEGVYFDYESIDPNADEVALPEDDPDRFSWAQRSRDNKKAMQKKYQAIDREVAGGRGRKYRPRKGDKRDPHANSTGSSAQRPPAASAVPSDRPVRAPHSLAVEAPATQPAGAIPDELLVRPRHQAAPEAAAEAPGAGRASRAPDTQARATAGPLQAAPASSAALQPAHSNQERASDEDANPSSTASHSSSSSGSSAAAAVTLGDSAAGPAAGSSRRQRLLQRMKGGHGAAEAAAAPPAANTTEGPPSPSAAGDEMEAGPAPAAPPAKRDREATPASSSASAEDMALTAAAAAATVAAGDLRQQLSSMVARLPAESSLPEEARPARALLESILSPDADDMRQATSGDVTHMLERELQESREFQDWLRRARGQGGGAEDELSEAETADLMAALENLDLGEVAQPDLNLDMDLDLEAALGGLGGDEAVDTALREVLELRRLIAAMDEPGPRGAAAGGEKDDGAELTDEQVLAGLRRNDPALYELLKDVPDLERLGLDADLQLELGAGAGELTEEEVARLAAEVGGGGSGSGGEEEDEDEELEALLRDMRGMGLMREDGASDDEEDDDEDDEGDLLSGEEGAGGAGLGELLEALEEDEGLDPAARMRAQFALQSMFNTPVDELAAKGARGAAGAGRGQGQAEPAARPAARGTTGMAREAVGADDEDGGAAPPPLLPRPKPKRM